MFSFSVWQLLIVLVPVGMIISPIVVAVKKGRAVPLWLIYSVLIGITGIPLIHSFLLKPYKMCQHCKENVMIDAIVCKSCHRDI